MNQVICFGEALIDMFTVDHVQSGPLSLPQFSQFPGGAPANAAVAVAKLGGKACFAGQVGNDSFGEFLIGALAAYQVNIEFVSRHPSAKTALAFVQLDKDGERSFSFYRDKTADVLFERAQVSRRWFNPNSLFHFCSNTLTASKIARTTAYAVEQARDANTLVSFDVNLRHNLWPKGFADADLVNRLVSRAHLVKFSKDELEYLCTGEPDIYIHRCLRQGCRLLVVTDGGGDIRFYGQNFFGSITPPKVEVIDTTAGGDGFIGGLLYALSRFDSPMQALINKALMKELIQWASACGAHAVTQHGAFPALPDAQCTLLQSRPLDDIVGQHQSMETT